MKSRISIRRTTCIWLLSLLFVWMLPVIVQAQFSYVTNDNGTITITGYTGSGGDVVIPDTIDGLPVTGIGRGAFLSCTNLTSVTIPNGVTWIGYAAFSCCANLGTVTILDGVTSIGSYAFSSCSSLTNLSIPNSVTGIGDYAFYHCTSLTSLTLPSSVTWYGTYVFLDCTNLANVTLPHGLATIEFGLFCGCSRLTNITIPSSVTSIGHLAFALCTSLTGITIPNNVTNIGIRAFTSCDNLTNVTIGNSVSCIDAEAFAFCTSLTACAVDVANTDFRSLDGVLFDSSQRTLVQYPCGKAGSYTIPGSVASIARWTFVGSASLTHITIPNRVTWIGGQPFYGCSSLTAVYFQGDAPNHDWNTFDNANNVTVYYLPSTTGWSATFGGRPTALWMPQVLATDASFGVATDQFGFTIAWASSMVVVVEASTDLSSTGWLPLQTNTLSSDSLYFSDPDWTNHPARFYRLRSP